MYIHLFSTIFVNYNYCTKKKLLFAELYIMLAGPQPPC